MFDKFYFIFSQKQCKIIVWQIKQFQLNCTY
jgi:hypothetical protein